MDGVPLLEQLNEIGGKHGVGRIDHVENRLVGIKSRELYEAPAAVILHEAHRELETLCLSKQSHRFKTLVSQEYADLIYNGLWFSAFHQDLFAFVASNQRFVTGVDAGEAVQGQGDGGRPQERLQPLQQEAGDLRRRASDYDQEAAKGFIKIHGLGQQTQARTQLLKDGRGFDLPGLLRHEK